MRIDVCEKSGNLSHSLFQLMGLVLLAGLFTLSGCIPMVRVTNLEEPACEAEIKRASSSILDQGEAQGIGLGAEYTFYFAKNDSRCSLRLEVFANEYRRTINRGDREGLPHVIFMAQRELPSCSCSE
jgi:hypothetical protein